MHVGRDGPWPEQPKHETTARGEAYGGVRSHRGPEDRIPLGFGHLGRIILERNLSLSLALQEPWWLVHTRGQRFRWRKLKEVNPHGHPGNVWQCQEFNQIPAQCLNQTETLPECVALGSQRKADVKGH